MFSFAKEFPEKVGIPSSCIKKILQTLDEKEIPMHSLLIMKDDKLIFEKYYAPYKEYTLHRMFSISKTFSALGICILQDEDKISIDDPIVKYFPEYTDDSTHPWIKMTTIRNMLMMRTCHAACTYKVNMKSDWVESFFTVPPTHKPGTVFHYDTSAAHVLCALVEKLSGMDLLSYLKDRAFKHLDFSENSYMIKDPFGVSMGGSGLMATPMDILKVMYLLDKKGTVICSDGQVRTLLDPSFILPATGNLSDTVMTAPILGEAQGYGMQIWQNETGGFLFYGMGGQLGISIPSAKMLIFTTADTQGMQGANQIIYDTIYEHLLPFIQDHAIESDSEHGISDYDDLMETAKRLSITPPRLPKCRRNEVITSFIEKKKESLGGSSSNNGLCLEYDLAENKQGFKTLHLSFSEEGSSTLSLTRTVSESNEKTPTADVLVNETITINFGINKMCDGSFPEHNTPYVAGAVWLRENVLFIKVHLVGECVGSIRFELYFEEREVTVFMHKIEETYFNEFEGHLYGTIQ